MRHVPDVPWRGAAKRCPRGFPGAPRARLPSSHAGFGRVPNLDLPQFLPEAQVCANGIRGASAGKGIGEAILRGNLLVTGPEEGDELEWVGTGTVYGGAPVEVRAGDASGGADLAEEGTGVDEVAGLHGDGLEMRVEGV